jgi:O-antigen/teichoic acid export membrane protein
MNVSLTDRSLRAVKWNYLGVLARIVSQLIVQITLARLLGPNTFGLFATAVLAIGVGNVIVEMGLGSALVQKRALSETDIRFAFTWVLISGISIAFAVFLLAEHIAEFFNDHRIAAVLRGLTPVLIVQALTVVPSSLLKRELAFKTIQGVQIVSYIGGFLVIGVGAALLGGGAWSLVAAWIGQTGIAAAILLFIKRHPAKLLLLEKGALKGFGLRVLITNIANWTIENVDNLLVSRFLGPAALGLYSVSYNLVRNPTNHLVVTLQNVLFPASARAQDNQDGLRRAYLTVLAGVALIAFPLFAGAAAISGTMVAALFGERWVEAGPVLLPLALSMILHSAMTGSVVLWATNQVEKEMRVQVRVMLILVPVLVAAAQISLIVVAWAVFVLYSLRAAWLVAVILKTLRLTWQHFFSAVKGGFFLAILSVAILQATDRALASLGLESVARLAYDVTIAAIALALCGLVFHRYLIYDDLRPILCSVIGEPLAKRLSRINRC